MGFDWEFILGDGTDDLADRYDAQIVEDYEGGYEKRCYPRKNSMKENTKVQYKTTKCKGDNNMFHTIRNAELKNDTGALILVKGKVTYSHIGRLIQGEELKSQNESNMQRGMPRYYHAYTTMTVTEAVVQVADADHPSLPEQWAMGKLYKSRSARAKKDAMNFRADCVSSILPSVFKTVVRESKTLLIGENACGREIASGTEVTLVLRVYESKGKMEVALQSVVVAAAEIPWYMTALQQLADMLHVDGIIPAVSERGNAYTEEASQAKQTHGDFELLTDDSELPF